MKRTFKYHSRSLEDTSFYLAGITAVSLFLDQDSLLSARLSTTENSQSESAKSTISGIVELKPDPSLMLAVSFDREHDSGSTADCIKMILRSLSGSGVMLWNVLRRKDLQSALEVDWLGILMAESPNYNHWLLEYSVPSDNSSEVTSKAEFDIAFDFAIAAEGNDLTKVPKLLRFSQQAIDLLCLNEQSWGFIEEIAGRLMKGEEISSTVLKEKLLMKKWAQICEKVRETNLSIFGEESLVVAS